MLQKVPRLTFPPITPQINFLPGRDALLIPVAGIYIPEVDHDIVNHIPPFNDGSPLFPSVWSDNVDDSLLVGERGQRFWQFQLLAPQDRQYNHEHSNKELLFGDGFYERNVNIAAFLSCIAYSESISGCNKALEKHRTRICGGRILNNGGGIGSKDLQKAMGTPLVDWKTSYLLFDEFPTSMVDGGYICYGIANPTSIKPWIPMFDENLRAPTGESMKLKWDDWVEARRRNGLKMKSMINDGDGFEFIKKNTRPIGHLNIINREDSREASITHINGVPRDSTSLPSLTLELRQWLLPHGGLSIAIEFDKQSSTSSLLVIKPRIIPYPCDRLPSTHAISVARSLPSFPNLSRYSRMYSFVIDQTQPFLARVRMWSLLLQTSSSDPSNRSIIEMANINFTKSSATLDAVICYYASENTWKGVEVTDVLMQSGVNEMVTVIFLIMQPLLLLPAALSMILTTHLMLQKKGRMKLCRENVRYSRKATEELLQDLQHAWRSDGESDNNQSEPTPKAKNEDQ